MKNILIFKTDRLGDLLNISPIISNIKLHYPSSEITLICSKYNYSLAKYYEKDLNLIIYNKPLIFFLVKNFQKLINKKYEKGIDSLIIKNQNIINKKEGILGWRVQLTFKSTKEEIKKTRVNFIKLYPEIPTYLTYDPPYYRICVGNFRTKNEALKLNNFIRKNYVEAYPVQKIIDLNLLRD